MSIKLLAAELSRFLGSAEPEVLCITGKWGVGKTYAWNYYLKQAQESHNEKLAKYSYIALFGRNSLDDVRTAIVENTVNSRAAGEKPDLKSFKSTLMEMSQVTTADGKSGGVGGFWTAAWASERGGRFALSRCASRGRPPVIW